MAGVLRQHGLPARVLRLAVPPVPSAFTRAPQAADILYVGRFSREKGVDVLLRAFAQVVAVVPSARLRVAGDGPSSARSRPWLASSGSRAQSRSSGGSTRASWIGSSVPPGRSWLRRVGRVVRTDRRRGPHPRVPVIATSSGAFPETVTVGRDGVLVANGSVGGSRWRFARSPSGRTFPDLELDPTGWPRYASAGRSTRTSRRCASGTRRLSQRAEPVGRRPPIPAASCAATTSTPTVGPCRSRGERALCRSAGPRPTRYRAEGAPEARRSTAVGDLPPPEARRRQARAVRPRPPRTPRRSGSRPATSRAHQSRSSPPVRG